MQLYQLPDAFNAIQYAVTLNDGELSPFLADSLDKLESDLSRQIEILVKMRSNLLGEEAAMRVESGRLLIGARARETAADAIERRVIDTLYRLPVDYVVTAIGKVRAQRNSRPSISYEGNAICLPERFRKTTYEADKDVAYRAWKAGETLPDGFVVKEGHHLRVT